MSIRSAFSIVWGTTCRALMPPPRRLTELEQRKRSRVLNRLSGDCVYCGEPAQTTDHFRPVVALDGMPTGYCSDAWNVVPCCTTCNSSKSNMSWRVFMARTNGKSPRSRGVKHVAQRCVILEAFDRLHRQHAQRWTPQEWAPQLARLRKGMEDAFCSHATRTQRLRTRIRNAAAAAAVLPRTTCVTRSRSRARKVAIAVAVAVRKPRRKTARSTVLRDKNTRPQKRTRHA